jgi:hypothetical protein
VRLAPHLAAAWANLGTALTRQGRHDEATPCYEESVRLKPLCPPAPILCRSFAQPLWDGSDLGGRTLFVYSQQGYGDTFQFVRFAHEVKQRGGRVILECHPELRRLLATVKGIDRLIGHGSGLPAFDVQAPLLNLPRILQISAETAPARVPYLHSDPTLVDHWRQELQKSAKFLVGIAWQGNPTYRYDAGRSIPLVHFARLARLEGVQLISLQKGQGVEQLRAPQHVDTEEAVLRTVPDLGSRLDQASGAFMDTAAVMMELDLVITSDTAVAHLAGALGVPVWLALPRVPDWRWEVEREDTPWYPTMRLFRQKRYGDWDAVFMRMAEELGRRTRS